jgi:uncharacterized protein YjbI with pentapeptide repeats
MADSKALEILKQGVGEWNAWRTREFRNQGFSVDLSGAALAGANLRDANFGRADLRRADLSRAELSNANLSGANAAGADLSGAHLSGVKLIRADLTGANLSRADIRLAHLHEANLTRADLRWASFRVSNLAAADLTGAELFETVFSDCNLSGVSGLAELRHHGASTIDHRTLAQSGQLPGKFLRGAGMPAVWLDYLPALVEEPLVFYACSVFHAHQDAAFAKRLCESLQRAGVRVWPAVQNVPLNGDLPLETHQTLRVHDKAVVVFSEHSVSSDWVETAIQRTLLREGIGARNRPPAGTRAPLLIPIRIDDAILTSQRGWAARIRRTRPIADFTKWKEHDLFGRGVEKLVEDLRHAGTGANRA